MKSKRRKEQLASKRARKASAKPSEQSKYALKIKRGGSDYWDSTADLRAQEKRQAEIRDIQRKREAWVSRIAA